MEKPSFAPITLASQCLKGSTLDEGIDRIARKIPSVFAQSASRFLPSDEVNLNR